MKLLWSWVTEQTQTQTQWCHQNLPVPQVSLMIRQFFLWKHHQSLFPIIVLHQGATQQKCLWHFWGRIRIYNIFTSNIWRCFWSWSFSALLSLLHHFNLVVLLFFTLPHFHILIKTFAWRRQLERRVSWVSDGEQIFSFVNGPDGVKWRNMRLTFDWFGQKMWTWTM